MKSARDEKGSDFPAEGGQTGQREWSERSRAGNRFRLGRRVTGGGAVSSN